MSLDPLPVIDSCVRSAQALDERFGDMSKVRVEFNGYNCTWTAEAVWPNNRIVSDERYSIASAALSLATKLLFEDYYGTSNF